MDTDRRGTGEIQAKHSAAKAILTSFSPPSASWLLPVASRESRRPARGDHKKPRIGAGGGAGSGAPLAEKLVYALPLSRALGGDPGQFGGALDPLAELVLALQGPDLLSGEQKKRPAKAGPEGMVRGKAGGPCRGDHQRPRIGSGAGAGSGMGMGAGAGAGAGAGSGTTTTTAGLANR